MPIAPERIAELRARFSRAGEHTMTSGCTDYACGCHFDMPVVLDEIQRQARVIAALVSVCRILGRAAIVPSQEARLEIVDKASRMVADAIDANP